MYFNNLPTDSGDCSADAPFLHTRAQVVVMAVAAEVVIVGVDQTTGPGYPASFGVSGVLSGGPNNI